MADEKKSKVSYDGKTYKKEWVMRDGSIAKTEYTKPAKTKTINQQLTENMEENVTKFIAEAEEVVTSNFKTNLKPFIGHYARYQAVGTQGKMKGKLVLRNGGFITKVEDKYVFLTCNIGGWSVQYANLKQMFVLPKKKRKKADDKAPKELKKVQEEVLEDIQEQKEEEEQKEQEQKEQEEAEEEANQPPPPPPAPRSLTDEEADALLKKSYYDEDMKFGRDKLYATLKANGHKITRKQVGDWLKKQALYQLDKTAFAPKDFVVQTAHEVNAVWNIDLVEVDGDKVVLNCIDRFSKFAYSRILRNKTAKQVINALKSIFEKAKPDTIISDNGPEFQSRETQDFLKSKDVKQFFSTPHQPQSNGLVERFNRTMKDMFKKMTYQKTENKVTFTQPVLNRILKAYNNSVHSIIGMSPKEAIKPENKEKVNTMNEKHLAVGVKTVQKDDVSKGDQVRISLNKGNDKKTKQYRTNWSEEVYFIKKVIRSRNGLKPIQYKVEDEEGNTVRGSFKRQEIQPIKYIENEELVDVPYEISKFLEEQGDEIKVSYKGYKSDGDRWIEKSILKNDLGRTVYKKLYDEMNA